ncbi:hypothetical protein CL614_08590 [archaeon]|nr:hypothetical protein [archaeon]|tara:strand:- start:1797 stop:2765 length:969 start_codon:yes stop_codon:yes gene_type:complete
MTKQIKALTVEEVVYVKQLLEKNNVTIVTQKLMKIISKKLNINRAQLKRRATAVGYNIIIGYAWNEVDNLTAGKAHISLFCNVCKKEYIGQLIKLRGRTYSNEPLCPKHYRDIINNSKVWREKNRQAQLIAQNRPDVLAKQRLSQKRRHADPKVKEHYRNIGKNLWKSKEYAEKVSKGLKKKWEDPEYADRVISNSKQQYHGEYESLKYQSLVELAFILWQKSVNKKIERYNLKGIKWNNNRNYYPDFVLNDDIIVEVKGGPDGWMHQRKEEIILKQNALIEWCSKNNYSQRLVFKKDIPVNYYSKAKEIHVKNYPKKDTQV